MFPAFMLDRGPSYTNTHPGINNLARVENGGELTNIGRINTATVNNGGWLDNGDYYGGSGRIENATVNGGWLANWRGSTIGTVTVNDYGILWNDSGGTITNATVNEYGYLSNSGAITKATVYGHLLNGGQLLDGYYESGTITDVTQYGGSLKNVSRIESMTYVAGCYEGQFEYWGWDDDNDGEWGWKTYTGCIGTLTLAGNSALNTGNWGNIENLVFDKDGNGVATLTAFDDGNGFGFNGIKADYVDFSCGNISLDLTGFGGISELYGGFYLSTLFGATGFGGVDNLSSLGVTWGDDSFWILNGDVWGAGWSIDSVTGFVSYEVPEPATLLMLGLAAAGLPVVRRLRRG